jgi:hypothetical protein
MAELPSSDSSSDADPALLHAIRGGFWSPQQPATLELTRYVVLRALGLIYCVAFLVLWRQMLPLFGSHGLAPADAYLDALRDQSFWRLPTLFWLDVSDLTLRLAATLGLGLALLLLVGFQHPLLLAALWALYLSFVEIGQDFYGYGWEILLLEAGFLASFLAPWRGVWAEAPATPAPRVVIWLLRWLVFRVMFGAGLIKIRGDPCWRDLSCLAYHYETQPNPHPLSWLLHQAPLGFHQVGVLGNHLVELVVPFGVFGPRRVRHVAGALIVAFQAALILSGNLSFLNWLTIAIALACFDDLLLRKLLPSSLVQRLEPARLQRPLGAIQLGALGLLAATVLVLSYDPVVNMLSPRQRMNSSFDPLHLVNSYGAFGSVGKVRDEVILEGTSDPHPGPNSRWLAYELPCKPGDVNRRPCLITPYHLRLDWQMWFAALGNYEREPWLIHLIDKLLHGDRGVLSLLANDPFPNAAPRFIRAQRYRYRFTRWGEHTTAWWHREYLGPYLPPLGRDNPEVREFLEGQGWLRRR